jgi:ribosome maturation factor RimP
VPWSELGAGRVQVEFGRGADDTLADGELAAADDDGGEQ